MALHDKHDTRDDGKTVPTMRRRMTSAPLPNDTDIYLARAQDLAVLTSCLCMVCLGRGELATSHPYCGFCLMEWPTPVFNQLIEKQKLALLKSRSNAPVRLPCTHPGGYLRWTDHACEACDGTGVVQRWVAVGKLRRAATGG